ncbi:MAG: hypothetical protein ABI779_11035 [Acidobacteriota bacterium]
MLRKSCPTWANDRKTDHRIQLSANLMDFRIADTFTDSLGRSGFVSVC